MEVRPPAQAARVVLAATRPIPTMSIAESVLPGLNPYQPNQRINPPLTAMVRSCGNMGPPPSRVNLRPSRGPRTMAPARAMNPPMVCTTVDPAKSWEEVAFAAHQCQPAIRPPSPVSDDWIDKSGDAQAVEQVANESSASDH